MTNALFSVTFKTGVGVCLLMLVGCASSVLSRHYILSPLAGEAKIQGQEPCISVGIGPVKLPEYLNRIQIVTRTTPNELTLSYSDLWAEPLTDSVPRTLADNLSRLICTKEVLFFPWRPSRAPDYRVDLEVIRMDGAVGGTVSLEVWWNIVQGADRTVQVSRKATYSEATAGRGYDALVQAHSRALAALSRDIAGALKELK
jgi:uncharacterized protein